MFLCYVDESGDTGRRPISSRHLLLGAAALFEGRWTYVRDDLQRLLAKYFPAPPRPPEIHATEIRRGKGLFARLSHGDRTRLLGEACQVVTSLYAQEVRLLTVIIDKAWWYGQHPTASGDDLYLEAFEQLVSRFDLFLRRLHAEHRTSKGLLIVDPHSGSLSSALKSALGQFQAQGTRWANVYNVIETALFLPSHESPGLQLADLCSYAVWRLVEHGDDALAKLLADAFDREPLNSTRNPGKWHGVKYLGADAATQAALSSVWPEP